MVGGSSERRSFSGQLVLARKPPSLDVGFVFQEINHGHPPDKQEKATQTVLEQAAVLSQGWTAVG